MPGWRRAQVDPEAATGHRRDPAASIARPAGGADSSGSGSTAGAALTVPAPAYTTRPRRRHRDGQVARTCRPLRSRPPADAARPLPGCGVCRLVRAARSSRAVPLRAGARGVPLEAATMTPRDFQRARAAALAKLTGACVPTSRRPADRPLYGRHPAELTRRAADDAAAGGDLA